MAQAPLKQVYEDTPEEQQLKAQRQAKQFDTATPEGMDALTQSLIKQKQAGADLTGMDAQLLRAQKLRDTPFNADGFHQTGGIGSAMSAFANVLDRRDGRKEYDGLQQQALEAKRLVASAAAMREAREMGFENSAEARAVSGEERAGEQHQSVLQKAIDAQANSNRDYALAVRGHEEGTFKDRQELGGAGADPMFGEGAGATSRAKTDMGINALVSLRGLQDQLIDKPDLFNPIAGKDWIPNWGQDIAGSAATQMGPAFEWAADKLGSEDPDADRKHAVKAEALANNRELVYDSVIKYLKTGAAGSDKEAARLTKAIGVSKGANPSEAAEAMQFLVDWTERSVLMDAQRSNFDPAQWKAVKTNLTDGGYRLNEDGSAFLPKTSASPLAPAPAQQEQPPPIDENDDQYAAGPTPLEAQAMSATGKSLEELRSLKR